MAIVAESTIPVEKFDNEYVVKTRAKGKTDLDDRIADALFAIASTNHELTHQIKLLNARFEEAFNTKIDENDI